MVTWEIYLSYVYMLGPTLDPLQGPPGSSLCHSVTCVKHPLVEVLGSFAGNTVTKKSLC